MLYKVIINISIPPQPKNTMLPIPPNTFVGHEVLASWSMKYPPAAKAKQPTVRRIFFQRLWYIRISFIFLSVCFIFLYRFIVIT
jgi:hypothetical protein